MTKATEEALASLHGALAEAMKLKLADGTATASDLNVIRQFLKDNGINADGRRTRRSNPSLTTSPIWAITSLPYTAPERRSERL